MDKKQKVMEFWKDVAEQNAEKLRQYFSTGACIKWHNTNELFTVEEYIRANCEYPGKWQASVERLEETENMVISVVKVCNREENLSFHATSFIKFEEGTITCLDEYWGDDGEPPLWRQEKRIGRKIL